MDDLTFKENLIYYLYRDLSVCKTAGLTALLKYKGLLTNDLNISNIYRAIINYQIKVYGSQLCTTRDNLVLYDRLAKSR